MMDYQKIGEVIKNLRKHANITQKDLAKNVCTQAQISKLENSEEIPSCITLYYLSQKLGVDMNYFFETTYTPRLDYVNEVKSYIREQTRAQNYEEVSTIINAEKKTPLFQEGFNKQFLLWHQGICEYYVDSNPEKALKTIDEALNITYESSRLLYEREIEILNSKAIIYKKSKEFDNAYKTFDFAIEHVRKMPKIQNNNIKIRLLYNMAKACFNNHEYERSIELCRQGVITCKESESLYLIGELYYQEGLSYEELGEIEKARNNYESALFLFNLLDKNKYYNIVQKSVNNLRSA